MKIAYRIVLVHCTLHTAFISASFLALVLCCADFAFSAPTVTRKPIDLQKALDVTELKIQMAESNLRLRPSDKNLSDLVTALEDYLNSTCLKDLLRKLSYNGKLTNPECVARMDRLFEVNPDNPVALCLRDGIEAPSCKEAYSHQRLVRYSSSTSESSLVDPSLKVGLSAQEEALLKKFQDQLHPLDAQWATAQSDQEKKTVLENAAPTYDKMMSIACRLVVVRIESVAKNDDYASDSRFKETREKLLQIPKNLREDYQEKMIADLDVELSKLKPGSSELKRLMALIELIRKPEGSGSLSAASSERVRYVLPKCFDLLKVVSERIPLFPSPVCHREGWYSPQCVSAIKQWQLYKRQQTMPPGNRVVKIFRIHHHLLFLNFSSLLFRLGNYSSENANSF